MEPVVKKMRMQEEIQMTDAQQQQQQQQQTGMLNGQLQGQMAQQSVQMSTRSSMLQSFRQQQIVQSGNHRGQMCPFHRQMNAQGFTAIRPEVPTADQNGGVRGSE
ncbi:unnamed protein product [Acanthocheilonema viteae]|uniref:Uncharacterized protein n=1 Tax=Acanthocheilonema viteae TaxID=6277 RepID=A0A498S8U0_ACAVI|nr:unnamed protein product [Acanthocheilonema viteae]